MSFLSFLGLDGGAIKDALKKDAVIIDIRSVYEYDQGRIPGSLNIPVDRLMINIERIREINKPIICCGSDSRTATAIRILKQHGITDVYDGGSWQRVLRLKRSR